MKIPTANVIIGFDKETVDRLFTAGATYTSLLQQLTLSGTNDVLLFGHESNPNFISFEHSMNFGGGWQMQLVFIDPKDEFESRFVSDNTLTNIAGFSHNDAQVANENSLADKINKDMRKSNSQYSDRYYADLKVEYQKQFGNKDIYVAYGTGDNLDLWAGPHKTTLTAADISMRGTKKITLTLTPTPQALQLDHRRGAYNEEVNLNLAGLTMRYSGESKNIEFANLLNGGEQAYNPLKHLKLNNAAQDLITRNNKEIREVLNSVGLQHISSELGDFDFHSIIVDAIRSYVQKATNNRNVIVLLPNINVICRHAINVILKTGQEEEEFLLGKLGFKGANVLESNISELLELFGLKLHTVRKEHLTSTSDRNVIPQEHVNQYASVEKERNASSRFENYYEDRLFYAILEKASSEGIPDHMNVLSEVFEKILKSSKEDYQLEVVVLNETDTKVLDFWSKGTQTIKPSIFSTFGGYNDFNENKEAIIVGDLALINQYLYGGLDIVQKYKTVKEIRSKAKIINSSEPTFLTQTLGLAENLPLAAIGQIPLHPLDKIILGNVKYNEIIRDVLFPSVNSVGAFGDISYLPDEFAYKDISFSDEERQYIKEKGISVLRYNTQNPNVLDMTFKFAPIYLANLITGFQSTVFRKSSKVAEGVLPIGIGSLPIRTRGAAIAYLKQKSFSLGLGDADRQDIISNLAGRISIDLVGELKVNNSEEAADAIALYLDELEETDLKGYIEVDQFLPGNPHSILADFTEDMYRKALQMNVKTLPMFHLSYMSTMSSPCLLFAQDVSITQSQKKERKLLNSFYSGLYKIMGFKHTINTGGAFSELMLVKNAPKFKDTEDE